MTNFGARPFSTTINVGHDHDPDTYTFHPVPHNVGPVGSLNKRSMGIPGAGRSISITCVCDTPHSGVSRSTSSLDRDGSVEMGDASAVIREKVGKGGASYMIPYVYPKPPFVFRRPSSSCMFLGSMANHRPSQSAQVQPVSSSKRSTHCDPLAVHTDRVDSCSPNCLGVITDLFSLSQTKPPYESRHTL